jgi:hypothetical protein
MQANAVRRAGLALPLLMMMGVLAAAPVQATDPLSPVRLGVPTQGFVLPVELEGIPADQVQAHLVFQRIAGQVVDANAQTVGGIPVRRPLTLENNGQGLVVDAFPLGPEVPSLPNGIYSERVELVVMPDPGFVFTRKITARATLYFRAINGTFQRLTLKQYSALVDPTVTGKNKLQEPTVEHVGATASNGTTLTISGFDQRIEDGAPYTVHGQIEPPND